MCRLPLEEPRRRQRLMREMIEMCDNWLRVDRIELTVFVDNAPAIKVYKKFGFEIEGTGKSTHYVMVNMSMHVLYGAGEVR